jgi:hypothetical protein
MPANDDGAEHVPGTPNKGEFTMYARKNRSRKGQCFVEALVGSMVVIPIALAGLDFTVLVLTNSANDDLAKNAARAAANQAKKADATTAAQQYIDKFPTSPIILNVKLSGAVDYQDDKQVAVNTEMTVHLPVGFQGFDTLKFHAQAVEPVVAKPADV